MRKNTKEFAKSIISMHRYFKRLIAMLSDSSLCILCTWLALVLRFEELILLKDFNFYPALISIGIALPLFWLFGLYRTIFRYNNLSIILTVATPIIIYALLYFLIIGVYSFKGVPRSLGILQPMLLFFAIISSRLGVKFLLTNDFGNENSYKKKKVLVYGAGEAGRQLVIALENSIDFKVIGFLDDNKELHRQVLLGQNVYSPKKLEELIKTQDITLVFLALPSISRNKRNQIIDNLSKFKLTVKSLPSISEIVDGKITLSDIKDLNIDDVLSREEVKPDFELLNKNIFEKNVVVTGAGGSIGCELCRQILRLKPNKLILLELNEFALYKIYEELKSLNQNSKIFEILANVQDQEKLETIFETFKVDTVYHAAAYKHVPIVEENICEGIKNNVFSTIAIAKASINKRVSNLVFISSDKAVRPTNVMGASKKLSELCMQGIYNHAQNTNTNFSIVRFGNVLESSGSVLPKFKEQIKLGGPVTLTHEDVTRYFMTITEAAQLVIQAGALGKNSEVFVLDMGKSVKIKDLIYKLIQLSGLSIRNDDNPDGDIKIKIIGLRPGEKLFEELLIGDDPQKTIHPKIIKASDPYIPFEKLEIHLNKLENLLKNNKVDEVKYLLKIVLKLYKSNSKIVDHIFNEKLSLIDSKQNQPKIKNNNVVKIKYNDL